MSASIRGLEFLPFNCAGGVVGAGFGTSELSVVVEMAAG